MESPEPKEKKQPKIVRTPLFMSAISAVDRNKTTKSLYQYMSEKNSNNETADLQINNSAHEQSCVTRPHLSRSISYPASSLESSKTSNGASFRESKNDVKYSKKYCNINSRSDPRNGDYQKKHYDRFSNSSSGRSTYKDKTESNSYNVHSNKCKPIYSNEKFKFEQKNFAYQHKQHNPFIINKSMNPQFGAVRKTQIEPEPYNNYNVPDSPSYLTKDEVIYQQHSFRQQTNHYGGEFRSVYVDKKQNKRVNYKYNSLPNTKDSLNKFDKIAETKDFHCEKQIEINISSCVEPFDDVEHEQKEPQNYCELNEQSHQRGVMQLNDTLKISFSTGNDLSESGYDSQSPNVSLEAEKLTSDKSYQDVLKPSFISNEVSEVSALALDPHDNLKLCHDLLESTFKSLSTEDKNLFLRIETGDFIPPPVPESNFNAIKNDAWDTKLDSFSSNHISSKSVETVDANDSETSSSICEPDSRQIEAITDFILGIVKEKSVKSSLADTVANDLNKLFKDHLEGNIIDVYGSYTTGLAISTSDINLVMKADVSVRNSFMFEVYKVLSKEQDKYHVHPFEDGDSRTKTKITFSDPNSGVSCQLAYLGKTEPKYKKMINMLRAVCLLDNRVKTLIIATKIWAEECLMNDIQEGKLHPIGFVMMMIHFLQHHEKPLLPVPIEVYQGCRVESPPPRTDSSVGELWIAFLKYFATTFNWKEDVVTIDSKECVSKVSKDWKTFWIAIEDPFTGKNIAESIVNSDTADFIRALVKSSYAYFCSPPIDNLSCTDEDSISNENSSSSKWQYSFQQCTVDQNNFFCEACEELDDVCDVCQNKIYVPPMPSVPAMTDDFLKKIKESLYYINDKYMLSDDEVKERKVFVQKLQIEVRKIYSDAELHLFGSSTNGFGFKNSDLDICMTIMNGEKYIKTILRDLRSILWRNGDFDNVFAIFSASIPIVKFHYKPKGWRGDICVNNTLAVHNSKLLYNYSLIDERCKILGCALKLLAKKALVAEVTDKALSSYSYLIMVIHFLQQTNPPVLPVLQDRKEFVSDMKLDDIVESCNVWYFKDYKSLVPSTNETSVEQLWLDLLDFYCAYETNRFITIRQKEPLLLRDNQISASLFNIQDPFIETKNLGRVVSYKKARETEIVFRRARQLFRTPVKEIHASTKNIEDYFFSTMSLTGRIHKEVHCDMCGKFGHEKKDCSHSAFPVRRYPFKRFPAGNKYRQINTVQRKRGFKQYNKH